MEAVEQSENDYDGEDEYDASDYPVRDVDDID